MCLGYLAPVALVVLKPHRQAASSVRAHTQGTARLQVLTWADSPRCDCCRLEHIFSLIREESCLSLSKESLKMLLGGTMCVDVTL